jgi:uncharacterized protein YpiB (UPF0302 family)
VKIILLNINNNIHIIIHLTMSNTDEEYVEIAKTNDIPNRQMKHVEVKGKY